MSTEFLWNFALKAHTLIKTLQWPRVLHLALSARLSMVVQCLIIGLDSVSAEFD